MMTTKATAKAKKTTRRATHSGHCQVCGRLQKLPGGDLSLHGYNVHYGFFSGVCAGSRHAPCEVSCALIAEFIASAKAKLAAVEAQQAKLRAPATAPRAWVHNYEVVDVRRRCGYVWREVEVFDRITEIAGNEYRDFAYKAPGPDSPFRSTTDDVVHKVETYCYPEPTLLELATKLNTKYAAWLEHEAVSLRAYIKWQQERVRSWKSAPLLPVDAADDKNGFEPTAAPY